MADCLDLLRQAFPDMDQEFLETMFIMSERIRLSRNLDAAGKMAAYKKLIEDGKMARALKVKNQINDALKLDSNIKTARRAQARGKTAFDTKGHLNALTSPLENMEANEINVNSVADSNQNILLGLLDNKLKAEGLEEAAMSGDYDTDVMQVMFSGEKMKGTDMKSIIVNKLADIYRAMNEKQRKMLNDAGASIFKRNDYIHRQLHNGDALSQSSFKEWSSFILDRLNIEETFNDIDMSILGMRARKTGRTVLEEYEAEVQRRLQEDYKRFIDRHDAVQGYVSKQDQDARATRSSTVDLLNRGRTYQFKDGASFKEYNDRFGSQRGLHSTLVSEYVRSSKKAALIQKFGSAPSRGWEKFKAEYFKENNIPRNEAIALSKEADIAYGIANGEGSFGIDNRLARFGNLTRSWTIVTNLGRAALSAGMDIVPTMMASKTATGQNLIKTGIRSVFHSIKALNPAQRKVFREEMLLSVDAYNDALKEAMMGGSYNPGKINRMISGMFKLSGLDMITRISRQANANLAMKDLLAIANSSKRNVEQTNFIARYGLTEKELATLRERPHLTPGIIGEMTPKDLDMNSGEYRDFLQKMHIIVNQRVNRGSPLPDNRTRRRLLLNTQAGTGKGEAARYFAQFKSAIMKITQDQMYMLKSTSANGNMMGYRTALAAAQFLTLGTSVGMLRNIIIEMGTNEDFDVEDYLAEPKHWVRGMATGGGMAIYGDIVAPFFEGEGWLAPTAGIGSFVLGPTGGNIIKGAVAGLDVIDGNTDKAAKFIINNIPYQNMWFLMNVNEKAAELLSEEFEDIFE